MDSQPLVRIFTYNKTNKTMKNKTKIELSHLNQPYDQVDGEFHLTHVEYVVENECGYTLWTTNDGNVHVWSNVVWSPTNNKFISITDHREMREGTQEFMDDINNGEKISYVIEDGSHIVDNHIFP